MGGRAGTRGGRWWILAVLMALAWSWPAPRVEGAVIGMVSSGDGQAPVQGATARQPLSGDGRLAAFLSASGGLDPTCPVSGSQIQLFLRNTAANTTRCISLATTGQASNGTTQAFAISRDGKVVAFVSTATNLDGTCAGPGEKLFRRDLSTGTTTCLVALPNDLASLVDLSISADGRLVTFVSSDPAVAAPCNNGQRHIFVHDFQLGAITCETVGPAGPAADDSGAPWLSGDGRFLAYHSKARNLAVPCTTLPANFGQAIFVRDRLAGTTTCVSLSRFGTQANNDSIQPSISDDGRVVAFASAASDIVSSGECFGGNYLPYVRDLATGVTDCLTVGHGGGGGAELALAGTAISADGRFVAFTDAHPDFDPACANLRVHVFVRDRATGVTRCLSASAGGQAGNQVSNMPALSADGLVGSFLSQATNLFPGADQLPTFYIFLASNPAPPTAGLAVRLNQDAFGPGETIIVEGVLTAGIGGPADAYIVLELPDASLLSLTLAGALVPGLVPIAAGLAPFDFQAELLRYVFTGSEPAGSYRWRAGLTVPGTLIVIGRIVDTPFSVAH